MLTCVHDMQHLAQLVAHAARNTRIHRLHSHGMLPENSYIPDNIYIYIYIYIYIKKIIIKKLCIKCNAFWIKFDKNLPNA